MRTAAVHGPATGIDGTGLMPVGTVWEPVRDDTDPPPVRSAPDAVEVGTLDAGDSEGDITVPPGHWGIGFRYPDFSFVYVARPHQMLALLDRLRADFTAP